ncbi:MAG: cbb3-type cytochrome oxidase assembly protein [Puniceicoccaceae bacterium]
MAESWDIVIIVLILFGLLFFSVAVFALYWAAKTGQFEQFEKGAKSIFTEEEPEGVHIDSFPKKRKRRS